MRDLRWIIPTLALAALLAAGCILASGQFIVSYELPTPLTVTETAMQNMDVDLSTVSAYEDHRENIKNLTDLAILGEFSNHGAAAVDVEVWMTPGLSDYADPADLALDKTKVKVWGPLHLAVDQTRKVGWDESAGLFQSGKAALIEQIRGDGVFTLYAVGNTGSYSFVFGHGVLVTVIDAAE